MVIGTGAAVICCLVWGRNYLRSFMEINTICLLVKGHFACGTIYINELASFQKV